MSLTNTKLVLASCAACWFLVGCSDPQATVMGTVTVGGRPLAKGTIQFIDQGGSSLDGGEITAGKYTAKMLPGEKTVLIAETIEAPVIHSTEELQKQAAAGGKAPPAPQSRINGKSKGNSRTVTVTKGRQTHDFAIEP